MRDLKGKFWYLSSNLNALSLGVPGNLNGLQKMIKSAITVMLIFILGGRSHAETINWDQLVEAALRNSPSLQESKEDLAGKERLQEKAKGNFYPELTFGISSSKSETASLSDQSSSASLALSQNLFNGFRDVLSLSISRKNLELENLNVSQKTQKTLSELKVAAATLIQRKDLLKLAKEISERQHNNQRIVELRFEVGRENKGSVLLSKANSTEADFDVLSAEEQLASAKKHLADLAGLQEGQTFSGPVPTAPPGDKFDAATVIPESLLEKKSKIQLELAEADVEQAKSNLWPKVDFSVSSTSKTANFFQEPRQDRYVLSMNIPLFSGFKDARNIDFFRSKKLATLAKQKATFTEQKANLEKAAQAWRDAYRNLETSKAFVKAQSLRTEIARSKYSNGLLSFDEWNNIEKELIQQQKALINAEKNIVVAQSNFEDLLNSGGN